MSSQSIITKTKIDLLREGVKFEPLHLFTNYKNICKYKTKKIKFKPTILNGEVYDLETNSNILPSEVLLSFGDRSSVCKLRYNENSTLELKIKDDLLYLYKNNKKISININFVEKLEVLNEETNVLIENTKTYIGDFVDIVGIDRISILFFEGCYNWNCGKACKFCDLHPKLKIDRVIKPTINNLKQYEYKIDEWWGATRKNYFNGIKFSLKKIIKENNNKHNHLFFMAGNLPTSKDVWNVSEDLLSYVSTFIDLEKFDTYLNIAPHDNIERLKRIKKIGIKQVQYNLEIANKELFEYTCPGKIKYDTFVEKLKEAVTVFGRGNVRTNFVFGLQDKDELLKEIEFLANFGIVSDYSVFQPKNNTVFESRKPPNFEDVIDFSNKLVDIYLKYNFKPIFCSLSSRSSIVNEIYEDRS